MTDSDELRNLLQRYARAADERDLSVIASLFHPEAVIAGARGEQPLAAWLDTMRAPRTFPASMHLLGDPIIDRIDDDHATLDTYAVVFQLGDRDAEQADLTLGIRYRDDVVRVEGRWVFLRRRAETVWMR